MKRKGLAGILSLLISVAVVGVGFASWVITGNAEETKNGNITVENIKDGRVYLEDVKMTNSTINFGTPSSSEIVKPWLTNSSIGTENLESTISGKIKTKEKTAVTAFDVSVEAKKGEKLVDITTGNLVKAPVVAGTTKKDLSWGEADSNGYYYATFTVTVTFAWGTKFGELNPYLYYNAHSVNDVLTGTTTYGDDALTNMQALYDLLNGVNYYVTVRVN